MTLRSLVGGSVGSARVALRRWQRAAGGRCVVCRGWCDGGLCPYCEDRFASAGDRQSLRCGGCAMPWWALGAQPDTVPPLPRCSHCQRDPPPWTRAVTGVDYAYPWDRLLADLKFHDRLADAHTLLQPLLACLRRSGLVEMPARPGAARGVRLVAVPLSRQRLVERGYNQSWELARRLGRALDLEARPDALFRVRDTGHQLGLARAARNANLRGAFVVTPRHAGWVRGASIALVDDVLTTGSTARSAVRTLLAAGAREVQVWVVARTLD